MNGVANSLPRNRMRFSVSLALDAWRGITWRHVTAAFLLGLAGWLVNSAYYLPILFAQRRYFDFATHLVADQIMAFSLLLAVVVADRLAETTRYCRLVYVVAVVAAAAFGAVCETLILHFVFDEFATSTYAVGHVYTYPAWRTVSWVMIGGFATFFYVHRRRSLATIDRLRAAELNRVAKSRQMIEARLKVMQARVEPQFLFNTLAQVRELHRRDPPLADRMLDDLIAYLRAAMPLMRDTSSTVGQELDLARAYLDIVSLRLGGRLSYAIEVPPESRDLRMPPMMLLPLVDQAIVYGLERHSESGSIRIATQASDGRLRLMIADSGAGFLPDAGGDGIPSIRERLAALYGDDARLDLQHSEANATQAVLDIPLEAARLSDGEDAASSRQK